MCSYLFADYLTILYQLQRYVSDDKKNITLNWFRTDLRRVHGVERPGTVIMYSTWLKVPSHMCTLLSSYLFYVRKGQAYSLSPSLHQCVSTNGPGLIYIGSRYTRLFVYV
jgi:hypothetical protein